MADPWPPSLPQAPLVGAGRAPVDAVLRVQPDTGPPISRRRYTAVPIALPPWETILTGTQYQTLETFFNTTLINGSLPFEERDPIDNSTVDIRFLNPPRATCINPNANAVNRIWRVQMELAIDP